MESILGYLYEEQKNYLIGNEDVNFEIDIKNNKIVVEFGWSDYEESNENILEVEFNNGKHIFKIKSFGHNVMTGDYENNEVIEFDSEIKIIEYMRKEIFN